MARASPIKIGKVGMNFMTSVDLSTTPVMIIAFALL
jgi:hypothetical protein